MIFIILQSSFESTFEERLIKDENISLQKFSLNIVNQNNEIEADEITEKKDSKLNPNKNVDERENLNNDKSDNNPTKDPWKNTSIQKNESEFDAIEELLDIIESCTDPDEDCTNAKSHSEYKINITRKSLGKQRF